MMVGFLFRKDTLQDMMTVQNQINHSIRWIVYYIISLLLNVLLIALYSVQTFTKHEDCYTQSGINILHDITLAFRIGLIVIVVDTIHSNIISVYIRYGKDSLLQGRWTNMESSFALYSGIIEWAIKGTILVVAALQYYMLKSRRTRSCVEENAVYEFESSWLLILIKLKLTKVVLSSIYLITCTMLNNREKQLGYTDSYDLRALREERYKLEQQLNQKSGNLDIENPQEVEEFCRRFFDKKKERKLANQDKSSSSQFSVKSYGSSLEPGSYDSQAEKKKAKKLVTLRHWKKEDDKL